MILLALTIFHVACATDDSGTSGTGLSNQANVHDAKAEFCVVEINRYRAGNGLAPLSRWVDNEACSNELSRQDIRVGGFHPSFGDCGEWAQDSCPNWSPFEQASVAACLEVMWKRGAGRGTLREHGKPE